MSKLIPISLKSWFFSNANEECKGVIVALPNQPLTVPQMACCKLNTPQHLVKLLANTLGEQLAESLDSLGEKLIKALGTQTKTLEKALAALQFDHAKGVCFNCGKPGHLEKDRSELTRKGKPRCVCPRCRKGKRFANQCHSRFDFEGRPLSLHSKKSMPQCYCGMEQTVASEFPDNPNTLKPSTRNMKSNIICALTSYPSSNLILLPPGARCELATSKLIYLLKDFCHEYLQESLVFHHTEKTF